MKHIFWHIVLPIIFIGHIINAQQPHLLIIDTAGKPAYYYNNILQLANSVGFLSQYKNLYQQLETPSIHKKYQAIIFMLNGPLLSFFESSITRSYIQAIKKAAPKKQLISLLFPDLNYAIHKDLILKFLSECGIINKKNQSSILVGLRSTFSNYKIFYDTTLFPKQIDTQLKDAPFGFMIKVENTFYFIGKTSDFNFADIEENIRKNPIDHTLRYQMLQSAQQILYKLHFTTIHNKLPKNIPLHNFVLPNNLNSSFTEGNKIAIDQKINNSLDLTHHWIKEGVSCAWLDHGDFFALADRCNKIIDFNTTLHSGIQFLHNSHFNLLWLEFTPERYLNTNSLRKKEKKEYINQINTFAQKLHTQYKVSKQPLPKIFVGMNITSNFSENTVSCPVKNIYGKTYDKIPCPLDKKMWHQEVLAPFKHFYTLFKSNLPIDGIFFDFEMYHAPKQAGSYTDLMIFSDIAWQSYCKKTNDKKLNKCTSIEKRLAYLQKNKQLQNYLNFLENEASAIGAWLKQELLKIVPHLVIGAYAPTLPNSWFYRGITKGLSSIEKPLIYATFNTNYYQHHDWLAHNNIYLLHGAPIMLSKLNKLQDFNLITYLKKQNYFVWYNRPSRMAYQYSQEELNKVWWGIEASPLNHETVAKYIKKQENKK